MSLKQSVTGEKQIKCENTFAKFVPEQAHENIAELTVSLEMLDVLELKIKKCLKIETLLYAKIYCQHRLVSFFGSTEYDTFILRI